MYMFMYLKLQETLYMYVHVLAKVVRDFVSGISSKHVLSKLHLH